MTVFAPCLLPPPIGHATGTARRAANRQDCLDANYRRDPGRGADEGCSLVRMWMPAHGSRSAHTLLYLAVRGRLARASTLPGARPQHAFKSARLGPAQVTESVAWTACPPNLASGSGRPACRPDRWRCMSYLDGRECLCCNESVNCPLPKLAVRLAKSPPNQVTGNLAA